MLTATCDPTTSERLAAIAHELELLRARLQDVADTARHLAAQTDWHSRAATAFHTEAVEWAMAVSGIGCLVETARATVAAARGRAVMQDFWQVCG